MQYARHARTACFILIAGCGSAAQPGPDAGGPDAAEHVDVWPWQTADEGATPADARPEPDATATPADALPLSACSAPATAPLRRLTTAQYQRTVRELTGVSVTTTFPTSETRDDFDDRIELQNNSELLVERWNDAAEEVVTALSAKWSELTGCGATVDDACARAFITSFGLRAYRRPLTAAEVDSHFLVFMRVKALGDASDGLAAVLRVMLQSPNLLYRPELSGRMAGDRITPSSWETATRLSYFLWGSMPDAALFAAAEAGELNTAQQVAAQIQRMLLDLRARQGTNDFFRQWLGLDQVLTAEKDAALFPAWSAALAASLREEGYRYAQHVVFDGDGRLSTLLSSTEGIVNGPLAQLYGATVTGTDWQSVDLSAQHRLGFLTQGWFLAGRAHPQETAPDLRGLFVRERLLCQPVPPPPPGINPPPPAPMPGSTTRERYESQLTNPACAGCHHFFDSLGFPFESFDAIGALRTLDNGKAIDTSGEIVGSDDADGRVADAAELIRRLAGSNQVRDCVAIRWYGLAIGREVDEGNDCRAAELKRQFRAGKGDLRDLMAMIALDAARRARPAAEVSGAISSPLIVEPTGRLSAKKIVLEALAGQIGQLRQRLALDQDRLHLDQHMTGLRSLELKLTSSP
jgi:hypothetical protein